MVKCSNCGVEVSEGLENCPNCGNNLLKSEEENVRESSSKCNNCGAELKDGNSFCPSCGSEVKFKKDSSLKCENCGSDLPENTLFCPTCGAKIKNELKVTKKTCPNCGKEIDETVTYKISNLTDKTGKLDMTGLHIEGIEFYYGEEQTPLNNNIFKHAMKISAVIHSCRQGILSNLISQTPNHTSLPKGNNYLGIFRVSIWRQQKVLDCSRSLEHRHPFNITARTTP